MRRNRKRGMTCRWSRVACGVALAVLLGTLAAGGTWAVAATDPDEVFVSAIAAGEEHSVALKSDGTVWTWGWNRDGQLGDGTKTRRSVPAQVIGLTEVTAISAGGYHTVALKSDGTVWTWGQNLFGQLGDGTYTYRDTPVQVTGLGGVAAIACGSQFTMALTRGGTVWVWGDNFKGVIGNWDTYRAGKSPIPVQKSGLAGVTAIAAGSDHAMALKRDGSVWTWGGNGWGQLGGGTVNSNASRWDPQPVLTGAKAIAAGGGSTHNWHSIIIMLDGRAWTFGRNRSGELGNGTTISNMYPNSAPPAPVIGLTDATAAAAGDEFTTALRSDGTVWSWGNNIYGQLGDGTTVGKNTPVQVSGLTGVAALVAGGPHALVLKDDCTVWAWGGNSSGGLGDGTTSNRRTPVQVTGLGAARPQGCRIPQTDAAPPVAASPPLDAFPQAAQPTSVMATGGAGTASSSFAMSAEPEMRKPLSKKSADEPKKLADQPKNEDETPLLFLERKRHLLGGVEAIPFTAHERERWVQLEADLYKMAEGDPDAYKRSQEAAAGYTPSAKEMALFKRNGGLPLLPSERQRQLVGRHVVPFTAHERQRWEQLEADIRKTMEGDPDAYQRSQEALAGYTPSAKEMALFKRNGGPPLLPTERQRQLLGGSEAIPFTAHERERWEQLDADIRKASGGDPYAYQRSLLAMSGNEPSAEEMARFLRAEGPNVLAWGRMYQLLGATPPQEHLDRLDRLNADVGRAVAGDAEALKRIEAALGMDRGVLNSGMLVPGGSVYDGILKNGIFSTDGRIAGKVPLISGLVSSRTLTAPGTSFGTGISVLVFDRTVTGPGTSFGTGISSMVSGYPVTGAGTGIGKGTVTGTGSSETSGGGVRPAEGALDAFEQRLGTGKVTGTGTGTGPGVSSTGAGGPDVGAGSPGSGGSTSPWDDALANLQAPNVEPEIPTSRQSGSSAAPPASPPMSNTSGAGRIATVTADPSEMTIESAPRTIASTETTLAADGSVDHYTVTYTDGSKDTLTADGTVVWSDPPPADDPPADDTDADDTASDGRTTGEGGPISPRTKAALALLGFSDVKITRTPTAGPDYASGIPGDSGSSDGGVVRNPKQEPRTTGDDLLTLRDPKYRTPAAGPDYSPGVPGDDGGTPSVSGGSGGNPSGPIAKNLSNQASEITAYKLDKLGTCFAQLGRYDDAEKTLAIALQLRPNVARTRYDLGKVLFELGRGNDAAVQFRRAVELDPAGDIGRYSRAYLNLLK
jgi:alpha-tubulin suppressor-like RCC1 family protein